MSHVQSTRCRFLTLTCINSLTLRAALLWPIHDHSHKYLSQLLSTCEQKRREITTYLHVYKSETQEPKWPLSTLDVFKKLVLMLSRLSAKSLHSLSEWVIHLHILPCVSRTVNDFGLPCARLCRRPEAVRTANTKKPKCIIVLSKNLVKWKTTKRSETVHGCVLVYRFTRADRKDQSIHNS